MLKCIFIPIFLFFSILQAVLPKDSEELLASTVFSCYVDQLKHRVDVHSDPNDLLIQDLREHILSFEPGNAHKNRIFYQTMILKLRAALEQDQKENAFLDLFCRWMFEETLIWDAMVDYLLEEHGEMSHLNDRVSVSEVLMLLDKIYQKTLDNPRFCGYDKTANATKDPLYQANIPYFLFRLNNASQTKIMRIPTVTKEDDQEEETVEIVEEFYRYLCDKALNEERHLYLNLRNTEPARTSIHGLELDPKLENHLYVFTLDKSKGSAFYWQTGKFKYVNNASVFMEAFLTQLFLCDDRIHFCWSHQIDELQWYQQCKQLMLALHTRYFDGKKELELSERLDFIDIFYLEITKMILNTFEIDSMNISCMYSIDRAPGLLGHLFLDHCMNEQNEMSREDAYRFITLIVIQPLLLHNRPAHDYRVKRLSSACKRMYTS